MQYKRCQHVDHQWAKVQYEYVQWSFSSLKANELEKSIKYLNKFWSNHSSCAYNRCTVFKYCRSILVVKYQVSANVTAESHRAIALQLQIQDRELIGTSLLPTALCVG